MVAMLRVLNGSGDTCVSWDPQRLAAGDPEAQAAVQAAERIFAQAKAGGAQAFRLTPGGRAARLDSFDPTAESTLVIPAMVGG